MDINEIYAKTSQFIRQYDVDLRKKDITAQQCVDYLCAYWNGMYTMGLIDNTGETEAGTLWTNIGSWFNAHGYTDIVQVFQEIGGGGGWTAYPLTSAP